VSNPFWFPCYSSSLSSLQVWARRRFCKQRPLRLSSALLRRWRNERFCINCSARPHSSSRVTWLFSMGCNPKDFLCGWEGNYRNRMKSTQPTLDTSPCEGTNYTQKVQFSSNCWLYWRWLHSLKRPSFCLFVSQLACVFLLSWISR